MRFLFSWFAITFSLTGSDMVPVLVYQKYFGAGQFDFATAIATDAQGNIFVAGTTNSVDFPIGGNTRRTAAAPLLAVSGNAMAVAGLPIGSERAVTTVAGSVDGRALYVTTPRGVFVSDDSGITWRQADALPLNGQPQPVVNGIAVDPIDSSRVYLATTSGLFGTSDAGHSWFTLDGGLAAAGNGAIQATSVMVSGKDHMHLFATTGNPNYLYRSTNGGSRWFELNPAYPGEVFSVNLNSPIVFTLDFVTGDVYAITSDGVLLKSADDGNTWLRLSGGLYGARSILLDPSDRSNIYVVDNVGLKQSSDGGQSFSAANPTGVSGQSVTAIALDAQGGAIYLGTQTAVYSSKNRGTTWTLLQAAGSSSVHALAYLGGRLLIGRESPSSIYLIKFDPSGQHILFNAFLGGAGLDVVTALSVDGSGEAILAGYTFSTDFPVTPGALQTNVARSATGHDRTGFVTKISADGSHLIYSTLLGPFGTQIDALVTDSDGNAYVTGLSSANFATTEGVLQPNVPAAPCARPASNSFFAPVNLGSFAFVAKVNADGTALAFSTFLTGGCGSTGNAIALDHAQNVVVGGTTTSPDLPVSSDSYQNLFPGPTDNTSFPNALTAGFLAKLSPAGEKLLAGTYLGGGFQTSVNAIALDASGNIAVAGGTWGLAKGTTPGAYQAQANFNCVPTLGIGPSPPPSDGYDAFVIKLDSGLHSAVAATYLGGGCFDSASAIGFDRLGNAWIAGATRSPDYPLVAPFGGVATGTSFVSELNGDFSKLLFSSFIDSSSTLFIAADGSVFLPGMGLSGGAYLAKIDPSKSLQVVIDNVSGTVAPGLNPPSPLFGGIAPGELIRIAGRNLGPVDTLAGQLDDGGRLTTKLGSTQVFFDGIASPLASVQADSILCFAPFEIVPKSIAAVQVRVGGAASNPVKVGVAAGAPEILAIVNQDDSANSVSNPASPGSVITLYVSGLGQTNPPGVDGKVNVAPLPVPVLPVLINVNGQTVTASYLAGAEGLAAGITQINVPLPASGYAQNRATISVANASLAAVYVNSQ